MIFDFISTGKFYMYGGGVDMRKGIHSLYAIIKTSSDRSVLEGDVFVFISTARKSVKMLFWQREGFVLYHKKLHFGVFELPFKLEKERFAELNSVELSQLVYKVKHRVCASELRRT